MPAGKGYSGKDGTAKMGAADSAASTVINEVTKWTFDPTTAINKYNANTTFGHKRAVVGVKDSKGTIELKVDSENGVQFGPGDEISLALRTSKEDEDGFDIEHAVIVGGPVDCDIDDGQIVAVTFAFESSDYTGVGLFAQYGTAGLEPETP